MPLIMHHIHNRDRFKCKKIQNILYSFGRILQFYCFLMSRSPLMSSFSNSSHVICLYTGYFPDIKWESYTDIWIFHHYQSLSTIKNGSINTQANNYINNLTISISGISTVEPIQPQSDKLLFPVSQPGLLAKPHWQQHNNHGKFQVGNKSFIYWLCNYQGDFHVGGTIANGQLPVWN